MSRIFLRLGLGSSGLGVTATVRLFVAAPRRGPLPRWVGLGLELECGRITDVVMRLNMIGSG
eukprot:1370932-Amorphochlora_amoeboformis.AAC.1